MHQRSAPVAPHAVPAGKDLVLSNQAWKAALPIPHVPTNYPKEIASGQTESTGLLKKGSDPLLNHHGPWFSSGDGAVREGVRPLFQQAAKADASKAVGENQPSKLASKSAGHEKDAVEHETSTIQTRPSLPWDVWYTIATVIGTVFTCILAPIIVEAFKGRMAIARHPADLGKRLTV